MDLRAYIICDSNANVTFDVAIKLTLMSLYQKFENDFHPFLEMLLDYKLYHTYL